MPGSRTVATAAPVRPRALLPGKSILALAASVLAIVVVCGLSLQSMRTRFDAFRWIEHTHEVEQTLSAIRSDTKDAVLAERGYLLTGDDAYLTQLEAARIVVPADVDRLRHLIADNPAQQRRLETLTAFVTERFDRMRETVALARAGQHAAALELDRVGGGKPAMDRIRGAVQVMIDEEARLLAARDAAYDAAVTWATYVTLGGGVLLLVMLGLIAWTASRDFRARNTEAWLRQLQMAVSDALLGDPPVEVLGERVLGVLAAQLDATVGALYAADGDGALRRVAAHAVTAGPDEIAVGAGLIGQAARDHRLIQVDDLPDGYLPIASGVGRGAPRQLLIAPAGADGVVHAVLELGFLRAVGATEREALRRIGLPLAIAIRAARDRRRLQELLEETQRQGEELQVQEEELRVTNEELAERSGALERASAYKSEFFASMSHELRTPLNSSLILAKLLAENRDGNLTPEQIHFAQTIHTAGTDLLTLINDILDLSKIEAGRLDVRPEVVPLARVLDELVRGFQPIAADKQLALTATVEADAPATVETDPIRLQQILKNLLSNALKFTAQGGVSITVARGGGDAITVAVHDTGIGIAPDRHEAIFEAFRQADGAIHRTYGGTGLGLSISRDLARLLGGELTVASAPGRGSTFTLRLPARPDAAPAPRPRAGRPRATPAPHPIAADAPAPPPGRSLLIIEDDAAFAQVVAELAAELGFHPLVAATADDGLALARRHRPSAVVLDIGLPDRSGLAVLDTLKHEPATRHIPVHVVSASDHTQVALEMGAAGYAIKPVARDQLVAALRELEARFTRRLRRVLVVEDDPVLRDATTRLLAGDDVEIVPAGTAAAALELLAASTFDCMVVDLALPDRSGLDLLEEMARHDRYGFPPVIVYTGRALSRHEEQTLRRFSQSIIVKGARSPERLLDEVTLFLHQVEAELPPERQRLLRAARDREVVFEGKRILVVEDDVRNIFALSSVLEPRGAQIDIARNGREALDHLAQHPDVDLVLMDIMMPEMDGIEATRAIRAQPAFAKLPIIALTAKAMASDRERCLAAGANDYLAKPFDVDKLLSLARVWIRK